MVGALARVWRTLVPSATEREGRRLARGLAALERAEKELLAEGSPEHLVAQRARARDPANPLTAVYNLLTAHRYARTLQDASSVREERLAETLFELVVLHVVRAGLDPATGAYPRPEAIRALLATPDPDAVLAILASSPDADVRGMLRRMRKHLGEEEVRSAVTVMRWRYRHA